jgi:hypothetical protein
VLYQTVGETRVPVSGRFLIHADGSVLFIFLEKIFCLYPKDRVYLMGIRNTLLFDRRNNDGELSGRSFGRIARVWELYLRRGVVDELIRSIEAYTEVTPTLTGRRAGPQVNH